MLTNKQFARITGVKGELSPEIAEMVAFTIDLGAVQNVTRERGADGRVVKRTVKRAFPHLRGKGANLWGVTPRKDGMTLVELKKTVETENELDRKARLAAYIQKGYAFDERAAIDPTGGAGEPEGDSDTPQDEWEKFFADDVPMRGGRVATRKGGIRKTDAFEGFIDAAQ